jgi:F-type H+-transporting ATPase subunit epsilon
VAELSVNLVAMDRRVWEGKARIVVLSTTEGEMGILPGHEPVLALLADGAVHIRTTNEAGEEETVEAVVHGGFFSVAKDEVAILAETAELDIEIDRERAQRALDRIFADGIVDKAEKAAEIRARTRLRAAMAVESRALHRM